MPKYGLLYKGKLLTEKETDTKEEDNIKRELFYVLGIDTVNDYLIKDSIARKKEGLPKRKCVLEIFDVLVL